jgi:hypothetical protein
MTTKVEEKRFKVFQGILGQGGLLLFCWAVDGDAAVAKFKARFGYKARPETELTIFAILQKDDAKKSA